MMSSQGWNYQARGDLYKARCVSSPEPPAWPGMSRFCLLSSPGCLTFCELCRCVVRCSPLDRKKTCRVLGELAFLCTFVLTPRPDFWFIFLYSLLKLPWPPTRPAVTLQNGLAGVGMGQAPPCSVHCPLEAVTSAVSPEAHRGRPGVQAGFRASQPLLLLACSGGHLWLTSPSCCSRLLSLHRPVAALCPSLILRALLSFCPCVSFVTIESILCNNK